VQGGGAGGRRGSTRQASTEGSRPPTPSAGASGAAAGAMGPGGAGCRMATAGLGLGAPAAAQVFAASMAAQLTSPRLRLGSAPAMACAHAHAVRTLGCARAVTPRILNALPMSPPPFPGAPRSRAPAGAHAPARGGRGWGGTPRPSQAPSPNAGTPDGGWSAGGLEVGEAARGQEAPGGYDGGFALTTISPVGAHVGVHTWQLILNFGIWSGVRHSPETGWGGGEEGAGA
jgi:hypothetical protein